MKTTEYKEIERLRAAVRERPERLYPNVGEIKRLEQAYERLDLDISVLREQPAGSRGPVRQ